MPVKTATGGLSSVDEAPPTPFRVTIDRQWWVSKREANTKANAVCLCLRQRV